MRKITFFTGLTIIASSFCLIGSGSAQAATNVHNVTYNHFSKIVSREKLIV